MLALSGLSPSEGSKNISLNTDIEFTILDDGSGINTSSIIVNINGQRALTGINFENNWSGPNSEISFSGQNINILIDPENNFEKEQIVDVQIQVKNILNKYLNFTYTFKTIPEKPVLILSSPKSDETIIGPQYLYFEFEDLVDGINKNSVNLSIETLDYIINGVLQPNLMGPLSEITDREDGDGIIIRLDPIEPFRKGTYTVNYSVSDTAGNILYDRFKFNVDQPVVTLPAAFPQTGFVGYFQGIQKTKDLGDGKRIEIFWPQIATRTYQSEGFALIYQNEKRLEIFDTLPSYIASPGINNTIIPNLITNKSYSFAVRAMESYLGTVNLIGMDSIDAAGVYIVPAAVEVVSTVDLNSNIIYASSVSGFPNKGFLLIGREIIRYNGILTSENAFLVSPNGRGVSDTTPGIYLQGDLINLFLQCSDSNTAIAMGTPTYHDGYDYDRVINNIGLVVTDYSDTDQKFVLPEEVCGYHRFQPDLTLNGKDDCGSYLGGIWNGYRGMNLFERLIAREEVLLSNVGEPIILMRRIWNGKTCSCLDARRTHPKIRSCKSCYGTGYEGGYFQFANSRRNDNLIMVSFADTKEDLKLGSYESLQQDMDPSAWTIPIPAIRDRDLLIRFDYTGDMEFIYEVLDVTREKIAFRHFTRQRLSLKRLDKTDIVYTLPYQIPTNVGRS